MALVDLEAREMASEAMNSVIAHERVCAERWSQVREAIREIKHILGWGISGIAGAMGTIILWLISHGAR